ncbi:MAG: amidoligase family protein [bacterium]
MSNKTQWLPPRPASKSGDVRRVGIEIELAGLEPEELTAAIQSQFGGKVVEITPLEWLVEDTKYGKFKVELDASYLQAMAEQLEKGNNLQEVAMDLITGAAEVLVPWEVVTPPIPMDKLGEMDSLIAALRDKGAVGTRKALYYAFGVHLNPELPDHRARTILNYLRAYLCLYDWIVSEDGTDITRRLSSYVKHFEKRYIEMVLNPAYKPNLSEFISDYLKYNPTRNRSLDLLPLLAVIDEKTVRAAVEDQRVGARPTFHFRLPNCDIDNPEWGVWPCWRLWLEVEKLADDPERLAAMCTKYSKELNRVAHAIEGRWAKRVATMLEEAH